MGEKGGGNKVAEAGELPLLLLRRWHLLIFIGIAKALFVFAYLELAFLRSKIL
jgi:hypothetical protein